MVDNQIHQHGEPESVSPTPRSANLNSASRKNLEENMARRKDKKSDQKSEELPEWKEKLKGLTSIKMIGEFIADGLVKETSSPGFTDDSIREYFTTHVKAEGYDYCIQWHVLSDLVQIQETDAPEVIRCKEIISKDIINDSPFLAFDNFYSVEVKDFYSRRCSNSTRHRADKKVKGVPFHFAAQHGNAEAIASMISSGKAFHDKAQIAGKPESELGHPVFSRKTFLDIVQAEEQEYEKNAFQFAVLAERQSTETLVKLLNIDGIEKSTALKKAIEISIEKTKVEIVKQIFKNEQLAKSLTNPDIIKRAINKVTAKRHDEARMEILSTLVGGADELEASTVGTIIEEGWLNIWEARKDDSVIHVSRDSLLHLAVFYQRSDFVQTFVNDYPESVSKLSKLSGNSAAATSAEGKQERYALWYNNNHWDKDASKFVSWPKDPKDQWKSTRTTIRIEIVNAMIRGVPEVETLLEIFHNSDEPFGELCFDISRFNLSSHRISHFIDSLIRGSLSRDLITYEQTLRYVEFPPLDAMVEDRDRIAENSYFKHRHTEVFRILDCLRKKGVRKIIKLKVPDRLLNPHDDEAMGQAVSDFGVEILDWKVPDMSLSIFKEDTKKRVKELSLYSSGKRAVIDHWFSDNGITTFEKLTNLEIKIIQETCTLELYRALVKYIQPKLGKLKTKYESLTVGQITSVSWYPAPKSRDLGEIAHGLAPKLARWLKNLEVLAKERKNKKGSQYRPTRVAILDNGILSLSSPPPEVSKDPTINYASHSHTSLGLYDGSQFPHDKNMRDRDHTEGKNDLWSRISDGRSFVEEGSRFSSWSFASNPHGTQMANLICSVDPLCKIYVARVGDDSYGITAKRVVQAIKWAIARKVDVISMSFVIGENSTDLQKALQTAVDKGIVLVCSTHDEGSRIVEAYPAKYKGETMPLIVIAACDEHGKLLRGAEGLKYDYMTNGLNVAAGSIPFLKSEDRISGSSVSTALTAGVCSLILTCDRLENDGYVYEEGWGPGSRRDVVTTQLNEMVSDANKKFVLIEKFGSIDKPCIGQPERTELEAAGGPSAKSILDRAFKRTNK